MFMLIQNIVGKRTEPVANGGKARGFDEYEFATSDQRPPFYVTVTI